MFDSSRADHLGDGCDGSIPVLQTERQGSTPWSPTILTSRLLMTRIPPASNGVSYMSTHASVQDNGKVRLGAYAPTLAPTADAGKVRLGAYAPTLAPAKKA